MSLPQLANVVALATFIFFIFSPPPEAGMIARPKQNIPRACSTQSVAKTRMTKVPLPLPPPQATILTTRMMIRMSLMMMVMCYH